MYADLRDKSFADQSGAVFVRGYFGYPWIDQYAGAGPSSAPFTFKGIISPEGKFFFPSPAYARTTPKRERDYARYPMVEGIAPPFHWVEYL